MNHRAITLVLAGAGSYDSLSEQEQAMVRAEWASRVATLRNNLNYEADFATTGESYSELDEDGNIVVHQGRG